MRGGTIRVLAAVLVAVYLAACSRETAFLAPQEGSLIASQDRVVVTTIEGAVLQVLEPHWDGVFLTGRLAGSGPVSINSTSIRSLSTAAPKRGLVPALLACGALALEIAALVGSATAPSPPPIKSCPFFYAFDGMRYVFEAEPYGGAISRALARTEWIPLEHLAAVGGEYRLLMTNELQETEHVDEVKLLAVDHAPGLKIVPDVSGRLHTVRAPQPPLSARDGRGRDVLADFSERDGRFWESTFETGAVGEDLRHEIVLEFPKPAGAKVVKLVADAWTTIRGSLAAKDFLENLGSGTEAFFRDVDARGPSYAKLMGWYAREELYLLKVQVETPQGWKPRAVIYGGGPFVAKEKAYVLDVGDIPGDILRIKMRPPAGFWRFDSLAVDCSEDAPMAVRELFPAAVEGSTRDVGAELAAADGAFLVMPAGGTKVELRFLAPPVTAGCERSFILKAAGWYAPQFRVDGDPRPETFDRIMSEPGFALRLAVEGWRRK
ncbi:MAG: hypothetical protein NTZ26_12300 [Candidatus Aminicenantes bacterium]|nr:hypothetical protein [Candidatus Aminicenantes bacterium]